MVCHTELDVGAASNNLVLNPITYGSLSSPWTQLAEQQSPHASYEPLSRILILKLAAKLHRFPLLGLQTIAAIYRQSRSSDINKDCLVGSNNSAVFAPNSVCHDSLR